MKLMVTAINWRLIRFVGNLLLFGTLLGACQDQTTSTTQVPPEVPTPIQDQQTSGQSQGLGNAVLIDEDQTTYMIDVYGEVAASGAARGETIYYYKCWVCHNSVTKRGAPPMKGIFDRPVLMSGQPLTEESVSAKIKSGGDWMPGFEHSLTDADIADLFSYFRSEDCCWEGQEPPLNQRYRAESNPWPVSSGLWGGPVGEVRAASGQLLEGMKVQLIAPSGVRTTVFTNAEGRYEFPGIQAGAYTLRIATPVSYKAYRREGVQVDGVNQLAEIVLEPVPEAGGEGALPGALPPTQEIISQLSGAEILWNLPGTAQEKATFARGCGLGCHGYQQIFRNRFDEHGWRVMVGLMQGNGAPATRLGEGANSLVTLTPGDRPTLTEELEKVVQWLAKVRGPDSEDLPMRQFPRPKGAATQVVITEYEMPRRLLSIHDTYGDAEGNIWYTSHRTPYAGVLDPDTGIITERKIPTAEGFVPGTHAVEVDNERGYAWFTERWAGNFVRLSIDTGEIARFTNYAGGNFGLAPDGSIWHGRGGNEIYRMDPETGEITDTYPLKDYPTPYQSAVSSDGRFWAGGTPPTTGANWGLMLDIAKGTMYEVNSGDILHSGARGGFEPGGHDAWFGGRDGVLVELVNKIDENQGVSIRTYLPPTPYFPYTMFYSATPDKNGEVWAGIMHGRGFVRYNTQTERWTVYDVAEPSALARHTWIDNTTDPVSIWYPDFHTGLVVRIQPRPVGSDSE